MALQAPASLAPPQGQGAGDAPLDAPSDDRPSDGTGQLSSPLDTPPNGQADRDPAAAAAPNSSDDAKPGQATRPKALGGAPERAEQSAQNGATSTAVLTESDRATGTFSKPPAPGRPVPRGGPRTVGGTSSGGDGEESTEKAIARAPGDLSRHAAPPAGPVPGSGCAAHAAPPAARIPELTAATRPLGAVSESNRGAAHGLGVRHRTAPAKTLAKWGAHGRRPSKEHLRAEFMRELVAKMGVPGFCAAGPAAGAGAPDGSAAVAPAPHGSAAPENGSGQNGSGQNGSGQGQNREEGGANKSGSDPTCGGANSTQHAGGDGSEDAPAPADKLEALVDVALASDDSSDNEDDGGLTRGHSATPVSRAHVQIVRTVAARALAAAPPARAPSATPRAPSPERDDNPEWPRSTKWRYTIPFAPQAGSSSHGAAAPLWCRVCGQGGIKVSHIQWHAKSAHPVLFNEARRVAEGHAAWEDHPRPLYLPLAADPSTCDDASKHSRSVPHPEASAREIARARCMVQEDASRLGVAPQPQSPPHPEWPASIKWRSFQTVCFAPEAGPRSAAAGGRSPPRYWCRLCREGGFTTAALQAHAKAAHLRLSDAGMRSNRVGAREVFERHPRPLYLPLSADPTLAEPERDPVHSVVHPEASAAEAEAARAAGPGGPAWDGDAGSGAGGGSGDAPQLPGENGENVEEDEESENKPLLLEPAKGFPEPPRQRRMMPSSGDPEWPPGIKWRCQGTVPFYPEANPVVPRSDTHWCRVCGRGGLPVGSLQNHAKMHHRDLTSLGVRVSAGLATWEAGPRPLYLPLAADPTTRPPGQTVVASCPHPDASDAERAAATAAAAEGLSAGSDVTKAGAQAGGGGGAAGPSGDAAELFPAPARHDPGRDPAQWPPQVRWRCFAAVPFVPEQAGIHMGTHYWCRVCRHGGMNSVDLQSHAKTAHKDLADHADRVKAGEASWEDYPRPLYLPLSADPSLLGTSDAPQEPVVACCVNPEATAKEAALARAAGAAQDVLPPSLPAPVFPPSFLLGMPLTLPQAALGGGGGVPEACAMRISPSGSSDAPERAAAPSALAARTITNGEALAAMLRAFDASRLFDAAAMAAAAAAATRPAVQCAGCGFAVPATAQHVTDQGQVLCDSCDAVMRGSREAALRRRVDAPDWAGFATDRATTHPPDPNH